MFSVAFDSNVWQYILNPKNKSIKEYILRHREEKDIDIHVYPSNINEFLEKTEYKEDISEDAVGRIPIFLAKNNFKVTCCTWRVFEEYIIGNATINDIHENIVKNNKILKFFVEYRIDNKALKNIRNERYREKLLICIPLLMYRKYPDILLNHIKWLDSVKNPNKKVFLELSNEYQESMKILLDEYENIKSLDTYELRQIAMELIGIAPGRCQNLKYLRDSFNNDRKCSYVLRGICGWHKKTQFEEIVGKKIEPSKIEEMEKNFPFIFIQREYFFRIVWGSIVDTEEYPGGVLKNSIVGDSEMLCYAIMCNTDYFITGDKAFLKNMLWIRDNVVKKRFPRILDIYDTNWLEIIGFRILLNNQNVKFY